MKGNRKKYERLFWPALVLSAEIHLALALVPGSVGLWLLDPLESARAVSRLEVVSIKPEEEIRGIPDRPPEVPLEVEPPRLAVPYPAEPELPGPDSIQEPDQKSAAVRSVEAEAGESSVAALSLPGTGAVDPEPLLRAYLERVYEHVRARKRYPSAARRLGQEGQVLLSFTIGRSGDLVGPVDLVVPCRHSLLNRAAQGCIAGAAPFPPIPSALGRDTVPVTIRLLYELDK